MKKQIVINASKDRSRIAIVEDGELVELYVENPENVRTLGNIYLGRVQKVMPTLRAAFVDVGLKQDAFLHFSDLTDNAPQLLALAGEDIPGLDAPVLSLAPSKRIADDDSEPDVDESLEVEAEPVKSRTSRRRRGGRGRTRRAEEEEEEQEEGRPRRRALVIDLTAKAAPPAAPAPPAPVATALAPVAEAEATPEAPDEASQEAPAAEAPAPRSRRRTRADAPPRESVEPTDETAAEPSGESAEEPAVQTEETADAAADEAPRSRRRGGRRRGRGGRDAADETTDEPAGESDDTPADAAAEVTPAEEPADDQRADEPAAAPERAPRGARRGRGRDAEPADEDADDAPRRAPQRPADPARARVDALLDAALSDLTSPVARRPIPVVVDDEETVDPDPVAAEPSERPSERPSVDEASSADDAPRGRRSRRRGRGTSSPDETGSSDAPAEARTAAPSDERDDAGDAEEAPRNRQVGEASRRGSRRTREGAEAAAETPLAATPEAREPSRRPTRESGRESSRESGRDSGREARPARPAGGKLPPTEELLRRDGRVLVKITKEPISSKGCRVSTDLSLAGRFLVLVPAADYVAVSKKIESAKERRRLRTLAQELKPDGFGVIVRTVADGRDAKSLETDLRLLTDKWRKIERKLAEAPPPPVLLYEDVNMVSSIIRDLFSDDFDRILVDDPRVFKNVQAYVRAVAPHMADKVELHKGSTPVYRAVGIERQVEEAFSKRVNLKGGGYLFIETTEAMHVVDVNSGRAGRGKSQKDNLIAVNVEAAREVAKQLRLRDLGGIIVVDFIDLKYERDRKRVTDALKEGFAKDRAVTKLLPMSDFGLVQITRQRLRPSITTTATDEDGEPRDAAEAARLAGASEIAQPERRWDDEPAALAPEAVLTDALPEDTSPEGLTANLRAWLGRYRDAVDARYKDRPIIVRVHPLLGAHLRRGLVSTVTKWKWSLRGIPFRLLDDPTMHPLTFDVRDEKSGRSLRKKYE